MILHINPTYNIIEAITYVKFIETRGSENDPVFSPTVTSYITEGITLNNVEIDENELSTELMESLRHPQSNIYIDGQFKICPFINIAIVNDNIITDYDSNGSPIVPLDFPIVLEITYNDPDNIGFDDFEYVKFKDRNQFIKVEPQFRLLDGRAQTTIESRFPGISVLRAKEDTYRCYYKPLEIRFRDG